MEGQVLESVNNNPFLGVELSSTLSWDTHIGKTDLWDLYGEI